MTEIAASPFVAVEDFAMPSFIAGAKGAFQFLLHSLDDLPWIKQRKDRQQACLVEGWQSLPVRHFQEKMEVIGHEAVGDNPHPGEGLLISEDLSEDLLVLCLENLATVHDTGHDVVEGSADSEEAGGSHGE
jgi:hypothetical protein